MDAVLIAFEAVLPLFLVIFTGLIFSKTGTANVYWVDILNKYALWIGFPALVIVSLMQLQRELQEYLPLILLNSVYIIASILLVFPVAWLFRLPVKIKQSLFLIFPFGNIAYLGIPVLENAYGEDILPVAAILSAVYVFWMLTLALVLIEMHGKGGTNAGRLAVSLIKNPLLLSVIAGLIIANFRIPIPGILDETLRLFSQSVTAIVLFSLGIFLGMQRTGNLQDWLLVSVYTVVSMIVLPAVFYFFLHHSTLPATEVKASILDAAMPLGLTPYVLSVQYNLESKLLARIVVFSTMISIVILPLWLLILG